VIGCGLSIRLGQVDNSFEGAFAKLLPKYYIIESILLGCFKAFHDINSF